MKDGFRQSMASLHTWTGLVLGWVLYFVFVTGTAGYLDTEIDRWMQPELPAATVGHDPLALTRVAQASLAERAPADAEHWWIYYPLGRNSPHLTIWWETERAGWQEEYIDPTTGEPLAARDTAGGQTLYRMHWQLHYVPEAVGEWTVGLATLVMFVALVTGIVVHRRIFVDFFTFRPGKGQRSWLDAHNLASVVTLPFQLMITYSGLVFMMFVYMPLMVAAAYGPDPAGREAFRAEAFDEAPHAQPAGEPAPLVALDRVLAQVPRYWGDAPVRAIDITHPNDANAVIEVYGDNAAGPLRESASLTFDGVTGELLDAQAVAASGPNSFRQVMLGLHEGLFAGPLLRTLYVLSGLLGSAMIATGLVLWTVKRRQRIGKSRAPSHPGLRLVERLNVATLVGLPVAIAAYFWANRLLPVDLAGRADWEVHVMFVTWGALFVHATLRPAARAWYEQWIIAAAAFGLLPLLNALTTDRHLGVSLAQGDWAMAGFDLTVLAFGLVAAAVAVRLRGGAGQVSASDPRLVDLATARPTE